MCDCKCDWLLVRFLVEEMKYLLLFSFSCSGTKANHGIEFLNDTRIQRQVRVGAS